MLPPCAVDSTIDGTLACTDTYGCNADLKAWALSGFTNSSKTYTVVGIAKDGHLMVGPYDSSGNLYDCSKTD